MLDETTARLQQGHDSAVLPACACVVGFRREGLELCSRRGQSSFVRVEQRQTEARLHVLGAKCQRSRVESNGRRLGLGGPLGWAVGRARLRDVSR